MAFVQKSIITMALGLDSMQRSICPPNKPGLCPEMLPVNGSILVQHLMNVSFSFLGEKVYFDELGDPPGRYEILNFQRARNAPRYPGGPLSGQSQAPSADYSVSKPAQAGSNDLSLLPVADKRRLIPHYDSYSTLKVYRPKTAASSSSEVQLASPGLVENRDSPSGRRLRGRQASLVGAGQLSLLGQTPTTPTQLQQDNQQPTTDSSGYSTSSAFEYVLVGSWESSAGLSLFGRILWPINSLQASRPPDQHPSNGGQHHFDQANGSTWVQSEDASRPEVSAWPPSGLGQSEHLAPESVCSLPCAKGHAKVSFEKTRRPAAPVRRKDGQTDRQ